MGWTLHSSRHTVVSTLLTDGAHHSTRIPFFRGHMTLYHSLTPTRPDDWHLLDTSSVSVVIVIVLHCNEHRLRNADALHERRSSSFAAHGAGAHVLRFCCSGSGASSLPLPPRAEHRYGIGERPTPRQKENGTKKKESRWELGMIIASDSILQGVRAVAQCSEPCVCCSVSRCGNAHFSMRRLKGSDAQVLEPRIRARSS